MLARRHEETTYVVIHSTVCICRWSQYSILHFKRHVQGIDFLYNVQHDCPLSKCTASGKQLLMQERVKSGLTQTYIEHQPIEHFVVNTHAFHNAHLLHVALPRSLVAPTPLHPDRQAKHWPSSYTGRPSSHTRSQVKGSRHAEER